MRRAIAIGAGVALMLLAGCSSFPSVTVPREISKATPVPCVPEDKRPARRKFRTMPEILELGDFHGLIALRLERQQAIDYAGELEAVVEGCSKIPPAPASELPGPNSREGPPMR